VPQTAGVVGHDIGLAGNVVMGGNITMMALVHGIQAEKVGTGGYGGRGSRGRPQQGCAVVRGQPNGTFGQGGVRCEDVFVGNHGGELQVRDGEDACGIGNGDHGGANPARERGAP
jgi:hypothetical protein